jgi:four helix bundle protein
MPSQSEKLRDRTKAFAVRVVRVFRALPYKTDAQVLGKQLLRSGTTVAANHRAACRARSKAECIAKIGIVVEEADETVFWLGNADGLQHRTGEEIGGLAGGST